MIEYTEETHLIAAGTYLCGMHFVSKLISYIFHPLILVYVLVLLSYSLDKFGYYITDERAVGAMLIMDFFLLVMFPMIAVGLLVGLKMISGFHMKKREDRIGPLLITMAFYIWFFINTKDNGSYPDSLRFVALGAALSVGLAFFINNFSKISLHAIGASSFCVALILLFFHLNQPFLDIDLFIIGGYRVSAIFVVILSLLIAGAVGSSRLYLKAHVPQEVYGGYIVGVVAQVVAFRVIM